jgi:hypothetical protein
MLHPVKVFKPTKELCYKNGMELTQIHTSEELHKRSDKLFNEKSYIHPRIRRQTQKEIEATNAGLNRKS